MLRWWVVTMLALWVASPAGAQSVAVAETTPDGAAARTTLMDMIGPQAQHVVPPSDVTTPESLLAWALPPDVSLGVLIALDAQRIYLVVPGERRTLERVLPADVAPTDAFAVALAGSELLEIAGWREPDALPRGPSPDAPASEPEPEPEPEVEPEPEPLGRARRVRVGPSLGGRVWVGLPGELVVLDARLAVDLTFVHASWMSGHPFLEVAVAGLGHDTVTTQIDTAPFHLSYAREALTLRGGLAFASSRRLELAPFVATSIEWVRVRATLAPPGATRQHGADDRAAITLGVGLEARLALGSHFFAAASISVDSLLGRAPYTAFGARVLDEPLVRVAGTLGIGARFPAN